MPTGGMTVRGRIQYPGAKKGDDADEDDGVRRAQEYNAMTNRLERQGVDIFDEETTGKNKVPAKRAAKKVYPNLKSAED